jgi:hypothetical protein
MVTLAILAGASPTPRRASPRSRPTRGVGLALRRRPGQVLGAAPRARPQRPPALARVHHEHGGNPRARRQRLDPCIDSNRDVAQINKDTQKGQSVGISGTPSFVIGRTQGDGLDGVRVVGAMPCAALEARINEFLGPADAK